MEGQWGRLEHQTQALIYWSHLMIYQHSHAGVCVVSNIVRSCIYHIGNSTISAHPTLLFLINASVSVHLKKYFQGTQEISIDGIENLS